MQKVFYGKQPFCKSYLMLGNLRGGGIVVLWITLLSHIQPKVHYPALIVILAL